MACNSNSVQSVCVIGSGPMGLKLATFLSLQMLKCRILLVSKNADKSSGDLKIAPHAVTKMATKLDLTESFIVDRVGQIECVDSVDAARSSDIFIEAITEDLEKKIGLFQELERVCLPDAILSSNTSSISIRKIERALVSPWRFIGLHFFNPPSSMKLVEVVVGDFTSSLITERAVQFVEQLDKTPVVVTDMPGFVVNRILLPMINDAIEMVRLGAATSEDIDTAMILGTNQPMGPLSLADLIGLDVCLQILISLSKATDNVRLEPSQLLIDLVGQGKLGRKTGEGFFMYSGTSAS